MRCLSAGLTFVNVATVFALALGILAERLNETIAVLSFLVAGALAVFAYLQTVDGAAESNSNSDQPRVSRRAARRARRNSQVPGLEKQPAASVWLWILGFVFALFALRSFCWLIYIDGGELKIQSPNNLGDLALHITYIRNFESGVALWPDNPIHAFSTLRYPAGADLFNALLSLLGIDLIRGLIWTGLIASAATFYAFWRWGGAFGTAGFLFNGGLIGLQFFRTLQFEDYQGVAEIAWKSIPLAMFVTQRGLLYAIPAGLLLLWHWREKYFPHPVGTTVDAQGKDATESRGGRQPPLPFWVELTLYATMPLYHIHTFLALSCVLFFFLVLGTSAMRRDAIKVFGFAFVPATFLVWLVSDRFHAGSILQWNPGWAQNAGDFKAPFLKFWLLNFGLWGPLGLWLVGICGWRVWKSGWRFGSKPPLQLLFVGAALAAFIFTMFVKTAPWEWDNTKLMIWAYFIALPFFWSELIATWQTPIRVGLCIALFSSGFVSVLGGLKAGREGFGLAQRAELDAVGVAVRKLPAQARFAAFPTYNHPVLLQGRKVVLGYPGHVWTQGFAFADVEDNLEQLMQGAPEWQELARRFGVRYIFWGREENLKYTASPRPWEQTAQRVANGSWGSIYDLEKPLLRQP